MAIPFDYTSEYKRKLRTPEEAARVVKSGDWLDISMGGAFPSLMDEAIAKRKDELRGVKIRGYLIQQPIQMVECDPSREHFIYNSWHMSGYERKLCDRGLCNFNPMVFRNLGAYYDHFLTVNVAITCVTPMNEHGYFNFSVSNASARAVRDKADVVILEVNENLPWVYGGLDECIHIDDVDMIVEGPHGPLPGIKTPAASETEMKIAEYVVQNMVDGSTLQLGIGSLPNAVGQMIARSDLRDLGIHTEMLCDSYLDMYKAGKINNKRKTLDRYKSVFGFAIGKERTSVSMSLSRYCLLRALMPSLSVKVTLISAEPSNFSSRRTALQQRRTNILIPVGIFTAFCLFVIITLILLCSAIHDHPFIIFNPLAWDM